MPQQFKQLCVLVPEYLTLSRPGPGKFEQYSGAKANFLRIETYGVRPFLNASNLEPPADGRALRPTG